MELRLGDVETTALIPLSIKANETLRSDPRVRDDKAVEIIKALGVDTRKYDKFMSHEGVIARTVMLDRQLKDIIRKEPESVIVNLGSGFDDRFTRVDNGSILWFDVDLPDMIAARKKAFPERERVTMVSGDILDDSWCSPVRNALKGNRTSLVFIAEGLFMYLSMEEIKKLLIILKENFKDGGLLIAEQNNKLMCKNEKLHDTVKTTSAHFRSGTDSAAEIAALTEGIKLVEEHSFNEEMSKHSIRGKIFAALFPNMNDRWATFKWDQK